MKARKWLVALLAVVMTCMMGVAFAACEPVLPEEGGETPTAEFTVTYYVGAKKYISKQVEYGNFAENLTPPDKEGSDFLYWCSDALMEHEFDFSTPITRDTNLYARYTLFKVYTATFDSAIPGKAVDVRRVQQHDTLTLPVAPVWEEGHKFLNWKNSDGTEYEVGATIPLEDDAEGNAPVLAFTAQWEAYTMAKTDKVDPTCTVDGNPAYFTCSACHKHYTAENHLEECTTLVTPKTGHTYGDPVWNWNEKAHTATATFTCTKCEVGVDGHAVTKDAKVAGGVTSKEATCTEAGDMTYTATVEFNGKTYSDTITIVGEIPATGHSYGEEPVWTIDDDHTKMTATFTCTKCEDGVDGHTNEVTEVATKDVENSVPSNCTVKGHDEYTAQVTFNEKTYDGRITVELPTDDTKHDWNDAEWKTTSTSHYHVCKNNSTHHKDESTHSKVNNVCKICKYGYDGTNYYLVGTINSWASSDSKTFAMKRHEEGGNKFYIIVDLKPGDAFKIIYSSDYKNEANFNNVSKSCSEYRNFAAADGSNISLKGEAGHYLITMVTVSASGSKTITIDRYWYTYTVTFDLGYEPTEGERVTTQTVSEKDHKVTLTTPERDGYVFLGWRIDGQGDTTHTDSYNNVTGDMKFVAVWHEIQYYDVTFDLGAHAAEDIDMAPYAKQERVKENTMIKLPAAPAAAEGWEFASWQIGEQTLDPGAQYQLTSSITVKANWTERKAVTVTWYVDGVEEGHDASKFGGDVFAEEGITYNYKTEASEHPGCSFDGWYTSDEYTVKHTFTKLAGNTNIYGRWIRSTVTVTYKDEKGETVATKEAHVTEADGRVTELAKAPTDTQTKKYPHTDVDVWEITKWHLESTAGEVYTGAPIAEDITLYGTWSEISEGRGVLETNKTNREKGVITGGNPNASDYSSSIAFAMGASNYKNGKWLNTASLGYKRDTDLDYNEIYTIRLRLAAGDNFRFLVKRNSESETWETLVKLANLANPDTAYFTNQTNDNDGNLHVVKAGVYDFVIYYNNSGTPALYFNYVSKISSEVKNYLEFTAGDQKGTRIELTSGVEKQVNITDDASVAKVIYAYIGDDMCDIYNTNISTKSFSDGEGKYSVKYTRTNIQTGDGTLTIAKYNTFNLNFEFSGGVGSKEPVSFVQASETYNYTIDIDNPKMAGFRFMGWQLNGAGELVQKGGSVALKPGDNTLTAVFEQEYTVTFDKGTFPGADEKWDVVESEKHIKGEKVTLPELPDPGIDGVTYTKQWKIGEQLYNPGAQVDVTGEMTVVAQYTKLVNSVEVRWHIEGDAVEYKTVVEQDKAITAYDGYSPKEGYVFDGWYKDNDYTGNRVNEYPTAQLDETYDYYARWIRIDITVTYVGMDGKTVTTQSYTTVVEGPKPSAVDTTSVAHGDVKRFFTYQHWSTDAETDKEFVSGTEITDNLTLYAWATEDTSDDYIAESIDDRSYYLVGQGRYVSNTERSTLNSGSYWQTTPTGDALVFKRDPAYKHHNVYTLTGVTLYEYDQMKLMFSTTGTYDWDHAYGAHFFGLGDSTLFATSDNWDDNAELQVNQSGIYTITLITKRGGTVRYEDDFIEMKFERTAKVDVTAYYICGTVTGSNWDTDRVHDDLALKPILSDATADMKKQWVYTGYFKASDKFKVIKWTKKSTGSNSFVGWMAPPTDFGIYEGASNYRITYTDGSTNLGVDKV